MSTKNTHIHAHDDHADHDNHSHGHHDVASKVIFGFWLFILSDAILFAVLFATYAVLHNNTFGDIGILETATLDFVMTQTMLLLLSMLTYGASLNGIQQGRRSSALFWLFLTFALGLTFVSREFVQFHCLMATGHTWQHSAFLSIFFGLMGAHWIHLIAGLLWMVVIFIQLCMKNITDMMKIRWVCFGLFWGFLNIIWVCIFTLVYLLGVC